MRRIDDLDVDVVILIFIILFFLKLRWFWFLVELLGDIFCLRCGINGFIIMVCMFLILER